jgi:hypothetical protein
VVARLYNKTIETKEKGNEAYAELLTARGGDAFNPEQDVWRLEFELKREGAKGFKFYAPPEEDDPDEEVEAEMSAEELQHIGTLPRFFAGMEELFLHLTRQWLRLVEESYDGNRSRWPMHPTWQQLREAAERSPVCRHSTTKSKHWRQAHAIADGCACSGAWRQG